MDDLISREKARNEIVSLMKEMKLIRGDTTVWQDFMISPTEVVHALRWMPSADAVEVVRCKDCKHHHLEKNEIPYCDRINYGYGWKDDDYCSKAERKEE